MRFMVIVKATKDSEAGKLPSMELLTAMEVFAIGHEYGHFFLEEGTGHIGDVPEDERSTAEEHFADAIERLYAS